MMRNERQTYDYYRAHYMKAIEQCIFEGKGGGPKEAAEVVAKIAEEEGAKVQTAKGMRVEASTGRFVTIFN